MNTQLNNDFSYVSTGYAQQYFDSKSWKPNWERLDSNAQQAYLSQATYIFETLSWLGRPLRDDQDYRFPRENLQTRDGFYLPGSVSNQDVIPEVVANALCETAYWLSQEDRNAETYYCLLYTSPSPRD